MTSRQRVRKVLAHEKPDRMVNGWGGCETAGMHVLVYHRLREALGLKPLPAKVDTFMFNAVLDPETLGAMGGDILLLASPNMCARRLHSPDGWLPQALWGKPMLLPDYQSIELEAGGAMYLLDHGRRIARCPEGGLYFDGLDVVGGWLKDDQQMPSPSDYHPAAEYPQELLRALEETAREAYESTDFALALGEALPDLQIMPGGMINWYETMLNDPDIAGEFLEKSVDAALKKLRALDQAVGGYCDILCIAHDLGDVRGVTIGENLFREIYKPHYHRLWHGWHGITRMKVNLHSCGSVYGILPDLIECGVDVLNPVQTSAKNMELTRLTQEFSHQVVFYGGAYDAVLLPAATPAQQVYEAVLANIRTLRDGGDYFFATVHNTVADTPPPMWRRSSRRCGNACREHWKTNPCPSRHCMSLPPL